MTLKTDLPADARDYGYGAGRINLTIGLDDARSGSHQGQCDDDIEALRGVEYIRAQLEALDPRAVANALRETGAWEYTDLIDRRNHSENLSRLLWLACCDIREHEEATDQDT